MQLLITIIGAPYELFLSLKTGFSSDHHMDVSLKRWTHDEVHENGARLHTDFSIHYIPSAPSSFSREVLGLKNQSIYLFEEETQQSILLDRLGFRIIYKPFASKEIVEEVKYQISTNLKQGIIAPDSLVEEDALIFSSSDRYFMINKNDLVSATSSGNYTTLTLVDQKKITVSKQIGKVLSKLPTEEFFRVHHSHIINRKFITSVLKKNQLTIVLSNNTRIPVSRRKKRDFLSWLGLA